MSYPDNPLATFDGPAWRDVRLGCALSGTAVASLLGVARSTLSRYEHGGGGAPSAARVALWRSILTDELATHRALVERLAVRVFGPGGRA